MSWVQKPIKSIKMGIYFKLGFILANYLKITKVNYFVMVSSLTRIQKPISSIQLTTYFKLIVLLPIQREAEL